MKKLIIILIGINLVLLGLFFSLYPKINLKNSDVTLVLGEEYQEMGYTAKNLFVNLKDKVKISNNIDVDKVGIYQVDYKLKYLFFNLSKRQTVKVVDGEAPIIELSGSDKVTVCPNKIYEEEGYKAIDNYDGDITDKVIVEVLPNRNIYLVKDTSGLEARVTREIEYKDEEGPVITLNGGASSTLYVGTSYSDPGYTAIDNCDGDVTSKVQVSGSVDGYKVGTYTITYSVSDEAGNSSSVERTVRVIERPISYGNGKIYLTFDDGPSSTITPQILDILRDEGVKATFFILNKSETLNYLIAREASEGHTVALHGATHDYAYIYSSPDNFFSDLNAISSKVYNITGVEAKIFRFPGGSSNTISRHYYTGIMSYLTGEVNSRGYHYFDWNVDSNDAGSAQNSSQVYYNVTNNLSHNKTNVVLMHDFENNYKTLNALRDIIKFGKDNGYSFDAITMDTPVVHHGVNN